MIASLLILLLFVALLVPGWKAVNVVHWRKAVALGYIALFSLLAFAQTGVPGFATVQLPTAPPEASDAEARRRLCAVLIQRIRAANLLVAEPAEGRIEVRRDLWSRLPKQAQDAVITCFGGGEANAGTPVKVVQRDSLQATTPSR